MNDFVYEFGTFRLDPRKKSLMRDSESLTITPKAFETLVLLIENHDRALSKNEMMSKLWPDSFVEEANLSQTIFVLRKLLGESAQDQRYIVTVRGIGYRFAEPVCKMPDALNAEMGERPEKPVRSGPHWYDWRLVAGVLVLMVAGLAITGVYRWSHRRYQLTGEDTIVLSDFENHTGDADFDGTLKQALTVDLEQTPFLSLISDQRVRAALKLMNRAENERLTRDVALEICQRVNSRAVIVGSIVALGGKYIVDLEALNCHDGGGLIASRHTRAQRKQVVLDALSEAAAGLRKDLGESLISIRKFNVPLREATTPSLEALKAFNAGAELLRHGPDPSAAIPFYLHAIELDPNFAIAYAYLGRAYVNIGEQQRAIPYLEKANSLRHRVSEREKLLLTSFYLADVTGETDKEIETYKIWIEEYPRDWIPVDSLAATYSLYYSNEYDKAAELYRRSMELDPQQPMSPAGLARSYLALNRVQDARGILDRAIAMGFENIPVRSALYMTAVIQGDVATAEEQARWSDAQSAQDNIGPLLFSTVSQRGQLAKGQAILARDVRELEDAGFNHTAALESARMALIDATFLDREGARRNARSSLALSRTADLVSLALTFALIGDSAQAQAMADELERLPSRDQFNRMFWLPCARAAIAISRSNFDRAIALLEPVRRYDLGSVFGYQSIYLRGLAYLGKRDPAAASVEFQAIIDHRGVSPWSPNWALARLGLARARSLQGDSAGARSAYEQLLIFWKDGDPALPIRRQVQQEYSKLSAQQP
jgi:DNA-binding winged helix-turn-helix (wHTH) protein/tetratricopeptide (TPR) repeat protein